MEYKRFSKIVPASTFKLPQNSIAPDVLVQVQFVPKGTAMPEDDGSTSYYTADGAILTLFIGTKSKVFSPQFTLDLLEAHD